MKRSLLYQLGHHRRDNAGPGDDFSGDEEAPFDRLVEEVSLAENLGLDTVWCLPEAGEKGDFRLGAPEFWLAGLASRTSRIRLGWGLAGLTPPDRPPIRSAEQAASLDIASDGRVEIAILPNPEVADSASSSEVDLDDSAKSRPGSTQADDWDEGVRMLVDMWDRAKFSWTSPRFEVPPVDVVPKPVQRPHPPIWLVGWSEVHARRAGTAGLGFFDVSGGVNEALEMHRDVYVRARAAADPEDLVCVSAYAVAMGAQEPTQMLERIEKFSELEFDQVVLRVDADHESSQQVRGRIRLMAAASADSVEVH